MWYIPIIYDNTKNKIHHNVNELVKFGSIHSTASVYNQPTHTYTCLYIIHSTAQCDDQGIVVCQVNIILNNLKCSV